jgi:AcrR family transcriptional regulator
MEDLGAAAGVSGRAVYGHFPSKQAFMEAVLLEFSVKVHDGGHQVVDSAASASESLRALIRFHVDFAIANPDVIRVQDRDLDSLADPDQHAVRALQRRYVELWVSVLTRLQPETDAAELRIRSHATFGLINSTPHSAGPLPRAAIGELLEQMAWAALTPL